jgi:Xaa-Pro dipeptidase
VKLDLKRIDQIQEEMKRQGYGYLILGPFSNLYYFTGLKTSPDERLQLLIIPSSGHPTAVLPEMYKEKAAAQIGDQFPILTWADQQDPVDLVRSALQEGREGRIAVDDTLWARHLLQVMPAFPHGSFNPASGLVDSLRMRKDENEILLMGQAQTVADHVLAKVRDIIRPGMREIELARFIEVAFKELGCDDVSFKPIVASGPNSASPHHQTGERQFAEGDFIVVDCGGLLKGYCSDVTRTFCLGKANDEMKRVYQAVWDANENAFARIARGGCSGEEADRAAREVIAEAGYGPYFIHRTGHGIGLDVHEAPYLVEGNGEELLEGMVFSIEPGIYLPGKFGVRIEDIAAITTKGPIWLSSYPKEIQEI